MLPSEKFRCIDRQRRVMVSLSMTQCPRYAQVITQTITQIITQTTTQIIIQT